MPETAPPNLKWQLDGPTADWTRRLPLVPNLQIKPQFGGSKMNAATWRSYITGDFPAYCFLTPDQLFNSPDNIIRCFQERRMLEGLALTIAWGNMARTRPKIFYVEHAQIEQALHTCAESIAHTDSIEDAWQLLKRELLWTDVITSKTLHFLTRALGYVENAPVPIDGAVVLNEFAPCYDNAVRRLGGNPHDLGSWRDNRSPHLSWKAYNRYMTAILCWAEAQNWTTTQIETTLFADSTNFLQ